VVTVEVWEALDLGEASRTPAWNGPQQSKNQRRRKGREWGNMGCWTRLEPCKGGDLEQCIPQGVNVRLFFPGITGNRFLSKLKNNLGFASGGKGFEHFGWKDRHFLV